MSYLTNESTEAQRLAEALGKLEAIKAEDLVYERDLGALLSFADAVPVFQRTLTLFSRLRGLSFDGFPGETVSQLTSAANDAITCFDQISAFAKAPFNPTKYSMPEGTKPESARRQLIERVIQQYGSIFPAVMTAVAYATPASTQFAAMQSELRQVLNDTRKAEEQRVQEREAERKEALKLLAEIEGVAGKAGVAKHATHFHQEARIQTWAWGAWLCVTVMMGGVTAWAAWSLMIHHFPVPTEANLAQVLPGMAARVLVLSVLWFGLVWSARNCGASQHNAVVNKHRRNALQTFESFVSAAGDQDTKNAVLLEATRCIFLPQATGYLRHDESINLPTNIVEIMRGKLPDMGAKQ